MNVVADADIFDLAISYMFLCGFIKLIKWIDKKILLVIPTGKLMSCKLQGINFYSEIEG